MLTSSSITLLVLGVCARAMAVAGAVLSPSAATAANGRGGAVATGAAAAVVSSSATAAAAPGKSFAAAVPKDERVQPAAETFVSSGIRRERRGSRDRGSGAKRRPMRAAAVRREVGFVCGVLGFAMIFQSFEIQTFVAHTYASREKCAQRPELVLPQVCVQSTRVAGHTARVSEIGPACLCCWDFAACVDTLQEKCNCAIRRACHLKYVLISAGNREPVCTLHSDGPCSFIEIASI